NADPVANNQSVGMYPNTAKAVTLTGAGGSAPLTYSVVANPAHGTLSGTAPNLTYTPAANYTGSDSFTFNATDGTLGSNTATISITVATATPPVANAQSVSTAKNTAKSITLTASDVNGDSLTYAVVSNPANGTLSGTAPNLTYTPNLNYTGADSFTFKANDGTADSNIATVTITMMALSPKHGRLAGGQYHSLVLKNDGTVWAWGLNSSGQLGNGTLTNALNPVQAVGLSNAVEVATKGNHSMALAAGSNVWTCGQNTVGQVGRAGDLTVFAPVASVTDGVTVMGGAQHSIVLRPDGTLWAWGNNASGQLGDGTMTGQAAPIPVQGPEGVTGISAGNLHTVALRVDGTVWTWGKNVTGQLGLGYTNGYVNLASQVTGLSNVTQVAGATGLPSASGSSTYALGAGGQVWAWGYNGTGQLGDGTTTDRWTPVLVAGISNVVQVAAGQSHVLALLADGTLRAWGANSSGQLGTGTNVSNQLVPIPVAGLGGVVEIAAGRAHSLAVDTNGVVWAWGDNSYGQLGDGTLTNRFSPVQVVGVSVL
ncbi:MAG: hypothetical protein B7Z74_04700, partial [Deltaproteobacteria bacterium 21-66-5]